MAKRKTVSVEVMVDEFNRILKESSEDLREYRSGICVAAETVLREARAYGGYVVLKQPGDYRRQYCVKTW